MPKRKHTLADLTKDWLERDGDTYLCIRKKQRLHWEKNLAEDAAYSSYLLEAPTTEDLIKRAYPIARNMIVSMNPPYKVTLRISNHGNRSYTDSRVLCVGTKMFDNDDLSNGEKLDTFLGTTIHEGCHLLWTNFDLLKASPLTPNVHAIFNIIEDERIEELCGKLKPGLAMFLEKAKYYYFDHIYIDETAAREEKLDLYHRFLATLLKIIRYPKYIDEEDLMEFYDYLLKAKEVLTPYPITTEDSMNAARQIYEIIREMYVEKAHERSEEKKRKIVITTEESESTDSSESESESSGEDSDTEVIVVSPGDSTDTDDGGSSEDASDPSDDEDEDEDEDDGSHEDDSTEEGTDSSIGKDEESEDDDEEGDDEEGEGEEDEDEGEEGEESAPTDSGDSDEEDDSPTEEEIEDALRDFAADASKETDKLKELSPEASTKETLADSSIAKDVKSRRGLLGEMLEGLVETGEGRDSYFTKAENNETVYRSAYDRIRKYIPAFSKILQGHCKEYKLIHRSMRSGVLDTNKLAEAVQGVPTVYIREGEVRTDKVAVVILIDESGSMCGTRIQAARDTAVLLNEAFSKVPNVELYIYGHTGDVRYSGATELNTYREGAFAPRYSLGSVEARCQNRDGVAIVECAKRVRKITKTPALMFVLSDGEPCAVGYGGILGINHTRASVLKVEQMDMQVVQVCINHCYDPSTMFKHFVILDNMSTLAHNLSKVIKKAVMKLAKTHVS